MLPLSALHGIIITYDFIVTSIAIAPIAISATILIFIFLLLLSLLPLL